MTNFLRHLGLLLAVAAAPLPFLYAAGIVQRGDLVWVLLANLCIVTIAARWPPKTRPTATGVADRWQFERKRAG